MSDLKMPDINNVLIAGNLTSDPIFRRTSNGTAVVNFYIASNRKYRDNSGIWRENICYVGVVAWHRLAEACNEILKKNHSVLIDGEMQSRNWHNEDGSTRNVVEIRARRVQFLDRKTEQDVEELASGPESAEKPAAGEAPAETLTQQETPATTTANPETPASQPEAVKEEPTPTATQVELLKIEPTDFDFGYQDLKL
jgi:single-strand DNA-binding protein